MQKLLFIILMNLEIFLMFMILFHYLKILDLNYCDDFIFANDKNYKIIDIAQMINKLIYSNKFQIINKNISTFKTSRKANNQKK